MEPLDILRAEPLDLLFENRNKSYGAYTLRKFYAQRLLISLGLVLSGVVTLSLFYLFFSPAMLPVKSSPYLPDPHLTSVDLLPPVKPVLPPVKPIFSKAGTTTAFVTMQIVKDDRVPPPIATTEELRQSVIGLKSTSGDPGEGLPESKGAVATVVETKVDSSDEAPEVFSTAEVMPEFPGGQDALKRFLLKNLRMPENNLETGIQVKVTARFVVGQDGKVRDIEIIHHADQVFDQEVKRVILKMPDWKPGRQHNHNVAVFFVLPVNFITEEQ